jgi:hypothetical protein
VRCVCRVVSVLISSHIMQRRIIVRLVAALSLLFVSSGRNAAFPPEEPRCALNPRGLVERIQLLESQLTQLRAKLNTTKLAALTD